MKGFDTYVVQTDERDIFIKALVERDFVLKEIPFESFAFTTVGKAEKKYGDKLNEKIGTTKELVDDTKANTEIIAVDLRDKTPYLVGASAWLSILNQYKINGQGFRVLKPETKVACFNELSSSFLKGKNALLIIIDDKVRAVMTAGDDGRTYTYVSPTDLLNSFEKAMEEKGIKFTFMYGTYTYESISATYKAYDTSIGDMYDKAGYIPQVIIVTSETGYASTKIIPCLTHIKSGNRIRMEKEAVILEHKGSNTIEKIKKLLPLVFVKQQNFLEKIDEYIVTPVKYPMELIGVIGKNIGLSTKNIKMLKDKFSLYAASVDDVNMYDIFTVFLEFEATVDKLEYEKMLGSILNLDIKKLIADIERKEKDIDDDVLF